MRTVSHTGIGSLNAGWNFFLSIFLPFYSCFICRSKQHVIQCSAQRTEQMLSCQKGIFNLYVSLIIVHVGILPEEKDWSNELTVSKFLISVCVCVVVSLICMNEE